MLETRSSNKKMYLFIFKKIQFWQELHLFEKLFYIGDKFDKVNVLIAWFLSIGRENREFLS